jgi:adenine phosphoribosyltransferase
VLEYGENSLELHPDLIPRGSKVVIHDDVLATGGTVEAISKLVAQLGSEVVGACFIIELSFLGGREKLAGTDLHALITY